MSSQGWRFDPDRIRVKGEIKRLFDLNVRDRSPEVLTGKYRHDGHEGHWLQEQFGLVADNKNAPDFDGFELKDATTSKTTFGDWTADQYAFFSHERCRDKPEKALSCPKCALSVVSRHDFFQIFGTPNPSKGNRHSWSGSVFPKVGDVNKYGQVMTVDDKGNVAAIYRYEFDQRADKSKIVPDSLKQGEIILASWKATSLSSRLERKFKKHGWFKCVQENKGHGKYIAIQFGGPIEFQDWIELVRQGIVFLDSGMYDGNKRPYSNWRADNRVWDKLVEETYPPIAESNET